MRLEPRTLAPLVVGPTQTNHWPNQERSLWSIMKINNNHNMGRHLAWSEWAWVLCVHCEVVMRHISWRYIHLWPLCYIWVLYVQGGPPILIMLSGLAVHSLLTYLVYVSRATKQMSSYGELINVFENAIHESSTSEEIWTVAQKHGRATVSGA